MKNYRKNDIIKKVTRCYFIESRKKEKIMIFKRYIPKRKKLLAALMIIASFAINLGPIILEYDYLNGPRNLIDFCLSVGLLFTGSYLILDRDKILILMGGNLDDDDEWEDED